MACRSCKRKRKKRVGKANKGDFFDLAQTMLLATTGDVGASFLSNVDIIEKNTYLKIGVKAALAYYLLFMNKNKTLKGMGTGVAINATKDLIVMAAPEFAEKNLGITGIGTSLLDHKLLNGYSNRSDGYGVAGYMNRSDGYGVAGGNHTA